MTMDNDAFAEWKLCWKANLFFYETVTTPQVCIKCEKEQPLITNAIGSPATKCSVFWFEGTCCSAGHKQATEEELSATPAPGICAECEPNYMSEVVKGKRMCRVENCRRLVRLEEESLRGRLKSDQAFWRVFSMFLLKTKTYECAIHRDDVEYGTNTVGGIQDPTNSFEGLEPPTEECQHDRQVCNPCLKNAFEGAIQGGRLQDLVCPDPECKAPIPVSALRGLVSSEAFKIYNKKLATKAISKNERFRWCTCGHGQIHGPGEFDPEWNCLSCKKRHCFLCPDEPSETCPHLLAIDALRTNTRAHQRTAARKLFQSKQNEVERAVRKAKEAKAKAEREAEEKEAAANKNEIARTTKKCPRKGCGNKIERNEGCGHFKCPKCQTDFCWSCKVIWVDRQALHLRNCRIGTRRTIAKADLNVREYASGWDKDVGYDLSLDSGLWLTGGDM